jgi:hypothetical protein
MQKLLETFDPANSFELKVGTRIMVTENLQRGVFNGAVGTVIRMTTKRVRQADGSFDLVPAVRVLMDTTATEVDLERRSTTVTYTYYRGARLEANRVRVKVDCSWWPFTLGWSITYHKVRGLAAPEPLLFDTITDTSGGATPRCKARPSRGPSRSSSATLPTGARSACCTWA